MSEKKIPFNTRGKSIQQFQICGLVTLYLMTNLNSLKIINLCLWDRPVKPWLLIPESPNIDDAREIKTFANDCQVCDGNILIMSIIVSSLWYI